MLNIFSFFYLSYRFLAFDREQHNLDGVFRARIHFHRSHIGTSQAQADIYRDPRAHRLGGRDGSVLVRKEEIFLSLQAVFGADGGTLFNKERAQRYDGVLL